MKLMRSKTLSIILTIIVILLIALALWFRESIKANNPDGPSRYSAVYLTTGDIYFGNLDRFPRLHLRDVWFLERSADPTTGQTQSILSPLRSTLWGSTGWLNLNSSEIVWTSPIKNSSPLIDVLEGRADLANVDIPQGEIPLPPQQSPDETN